MADRLELVALALAARRLRTRDSAALRRRVHVCLLAADDPRPAAEPREAHRPGRLAARAPGAGPYGTRLYVPALIIGGVKVPCTARLAPRGQERPADDDCGDIDQSSMPICCDASSRKTRKNSSEGERFLWMP